MFFAHPSLPLSALSLPPASPSPLPLRNAGPEEEEGDEGDDVDMVDLVDSEGEGDGGSEDISDSGGLLGGRFWSGRGRAVVGWK